MKKWFNQKLYLFKIQPLLIKLGVDRIDFIKIQTNIKNIN
jgi:hypothetical protein